MKVALILRKKIEGENSLEELAKLYVLGNSSIQIYECPCYPTTLRGYIRNIKFVRSIKADIYLLYALSESYLACFLKNVIQTVHDVNTINYYNRLWKRLWLRLTNVILPSKRLYHIVCVSENTKREYLKIAPWVKRKISVNPNPLNTCLHYVPKEFCKTQPVILHIGTAYRKNLGNVVRALQGIPCKMIIIGKLHDDQIALLQENEIVYENDSDVPFSKIVESYEQCDIVSFPSFYEGFGMPIIEANTVGRPVVASTLAVFHEIAEGCYCEANPDDVNDLRNAFLQIIQDDDFRKKLVLAGLENAKKYSLSNVIALYNRLFCSLYRESKKRNIGRIYENKV